MTLPVRSRIRSAIIYGLKQITKANGYYNDIVSVYSPERSPENQSNYPIINVYIENEQCENSYNTRINQNEGALRNSFIIRMTCYIKSSNDTELEKDKILADIQKYFGNYYWIPDSGGNATCQVCYYDSSDPFGAYENSPNGGIVVNYRVWYGQKITDPTILT